MLLLRICVYMGKKCSRIIKFLIENAVVAECKISRRVRRQYKQKEEKRRNFARIRNAPDSLTMAENRSAEELETSTAAALLALLLRSDRADQNRPRFDSASIKINRRDW
ncbi:hypothetical protein RB195_020091 [Necator americanus]|uniref:Uncharacterized protein n=1 Tax=Necator americanus TaxID=51031 RepID=A0ABR1CH65_NECAM